MGGKPPSNSLPVIKMDAIYFLWHSSYIDVCRQLFVLTWAFFQLLQQLSHLTPLVLSLAGAEAGSSQVSLESASPRHRRWSSDVPWWPHGGERLGFLFPLSFHSLFIPPAPCCFQIAPFLNSSQRFHSAYPHTVDEWEARVSGMARKEQSLTLRKLQRSGKTPLLPTERTPARPQCGSIKL